MTDSPSYPYEDAAEFVNVTGWMCAKCHRFHGSGEDGKHIARWCCCTDRPCETEGCKGRAEKSYTACPACISKKELARYLALPRKEWDGETPIVLDQDNYFFDADSLGDWLNDLSDEEREDVRIEICKPTRPPYFDMGEFLMDCLSTDDDGAHLDTDDINAVVNKWIEDHEPFAWTGSGVVPTAESVEKHTGIKIGEHEEEPKP